VSVTFQDDGAGLTWPAFAKRRVAQGLLAPDAPLTDEDAAQLVFRPVSTASEVSELAGRGIGMDVVRNEVLALGGRIETAPAGQGTRASSWCCR
jgi:chemosensory pili system protein ChpA (sensor histidine kinase/response regulator)